MDIRYKNYIITMNTYSWDLHRENVITREAIDGIVSKGRNTTLKPGDKTTTHLGFFTSIDTLIQKIIRLELEKGNKEKTLQEALEFIRNTMNAFIITIDSYTNEMTKRNVEKNIEYTKRRLLTLN